MLIVNLLIFSRRGRRLQQHRSEGGQRQRSGVTLVGRVFLFVVADATNEKSLLARLMCHIGL